MLDKMNGLKRTHYCTDLIENDIGSEVVVCGFTQKVRNIGTLLFIDLRDRTGILQLTFDKTTDTNLFEKAQTVRAEYILMVKGTVRKRASINKDIKTGIIEIFVTELRILAKANTPPFEIKDDINIKDELKLKYRYLDLRRNEMQNALVLRHKVTTITHEYFNKNGFLEIETPTLIKSTPEGARDYLVPSRLHPGKFFALPQSPQLFKQLLMVAGYDKYMQIAKCFRDEDLRADRQPEFTQIDLEMSFVDEDDIMEINEGFIKELFEKILNVNIKIPFKRLTHKEAMSRFGTDKPDTRFGMELINLNDGLKETEFAIFKNVLKKGGCIQAINATDAVDIITRKEIDKLIEFVKTYKAKSIAFTRLVPDSETSSYEKFLTKEEKQYIRNKVCAKVGDVILIIADTNKKAVCDSLGQLRLHLAQKLNLISKNTYDFLWVTEFPLVEFDDEENRFMATHHPFTCPNFDDVMLLDKDPSKIRARAYDMVLNGCEIGGGSIRINDAQLQEQMFKLLGYSREDAQAKFGFLLDAFNYGVPPHGGMAYGLDRLVMLMLGRESIKDVIAFPKVQNSSDLMTMCPSTINEKNIKELNLKLNIETKESRCVSCQESQ